jgi:hypothetical protein
MVDQEGQARHWHNKELYPECIMVTVIRRLELHVDEIDREERRRDEDHFHTGIVDRDEACD